MCVQFACRKMNALYKDKSGATAIEYALIAALIAISVVAAIEVTGDKTKEKFLRVDAALHEEEWPTGSSGRTSGSSGGSSGGGAYSGGSSSGSTGGSGGGASSGSTGGSSGGSTPDPAAGSGSTGGGSSSGGSSGSGSSGGGSSGGGSSGSGSASAPAPDPNAGNNGNKGNDKINCNAKKNRDLPECQ